MCSFLSYVNIVMMLNVKQVFKNVVNFKFLDLFFSRFFWELTRESHVDPSSEVLSLWVAKLSNLLGITIHCTQAVTILLTRRATYLRSQSRCIRGGRQREKFFSKNWTLSLSPSDFTFIASAATEKVELRSRVKSLEQQVSSLQHGLHGLRKRTSSVVEYSERHLRRLKKQCAATSLASLSSLEKEGLKPLKLEVFNIKTQKTETICLDTAEELLGLEEEECVSEDQLDVVSMMLYVKDRFNMCIS